jgi:hypothetical protein
VFLVVSFPLAFPPITLMLNAINLMVYKEVHRGSPLGIFAEALNPSYTLTRIFIQIIFDSKTSIHMHLLNIAISWDVAPCRKCVKKTN